VGKSTPKTPDPYKVAAAQTKSNRETAEYNAALNRIDQSNPYSSVKYNQSGTDPNTGAPIYSQSTTFSPQLQGLFDSQMNTQQGIADATTNLLDLLPQQAFDPNSVGDQSDIRQRSFDSQMAMLQPKFDEGWKNLETTMSDRGIPIGAEIWQDESNRFDTAREGAQRAAARTADQDASGEHQRLLSNALQQYNMPYQQLSALMGNSQAANMGSQNPFAQSSSDNTDVAGSVWNAYNADVARSQNQQSNMMGGLLGLGKLGVSAFSGGPASAAMGMASMFSDERVKDDIKPIGKLFDGQTVYSYRYKGSFTPQIGLLAQEVEKVAPEAVSEVGGVKMVRYDLATRRAAQMAA
jgi:hypothetical protein